MKSGTQTAQQQGSTGGGSQKTVSNEEFIKVNVEAFKEGKGIKYIASKLNLSEQYVTQRRSTLRNKGIALPDLTRGGAQPFNKDELNKIIAEQTGTPLEEVQKASEQLLKEAAERETAAV